MFCYFRVLLGSTVAMMSKRSLGFDVAATAPANRFRYNAADLFLSNSVSGSRAASLFADAPEASTRHVADLGGGPSNRAHRNLLRKLLKGNKWPRLYETPIRVWNRKTKVEELRPILFMLPHELSSTLYHHSIDKRVLFNRGGMTL